MAEEPMEIYSGVLYKNWLIDRYALGLPEKLIQSQFKQQFDIVLSLSDAHKIVGEHQDEIREREQELLDAYANSTDLRGMMYDLVMDLKQMLDQAKKAQDFDKFSKMSIPMIKALEAANRELERFHENTSITSNQASTPDELLSSIEFMQSEGIIDILDSDKLRVLLGITDEGASDEQE